MTCLCSENNDIYGGSVENMMAKQQKETGRWMRKPTEVGYLTRHPV